MARLQDKLQDGGDWPGETIKAVRKLKEIVVSDDNCVRIFASREFVFASLRRGAACSWAPPCVSDAYCSKQ